MNLEPPVDGPPEPSPLHRNPDFLRLWLGQTLSLFGSQITLLALPLTAALTLDASASEMGLLGAASTAPTLVLGPVAGLWADRRRRRPILIGADLGRASLLASIPLASVANTLTIEWLWLVALLSGMLTTLFDVTHASMLPSLVRREQLIEANSRFEISRSGAMIAGPGVTGVLIQVLTAPIALIADAASYLASGILIGRIRTPEAAPAKRDAGGSFRADVSAGLRIIFSNPILRSLAVSLCVFNFFFQGFSAVYILFVTRDLDLSPAVIGFVFAAGSATFPVGAAAAGWVARRLGVGGAIVWGAVVADLSLLLVPLASGPPTLAVAVLVASRLIGTFGGPITAINQLSLRQAATPDPLLGRVNGAMLTIGLGSAPIGALVGGLLGETIGLRPTVLAAALGVQLGFVILIWSPVNSQRTLPTQDASLLG